MQARSLYSSLGSHGCLICPWMQEECAGTFSSREHIRRSSPKLHTCCTLDSRRSTSSYASGTRYKLFGPSSGECQPQYDCETVWCAILCCGEDVLETSLQRVEDLGHQPRLTGTFRRWLVFTIIVFVETAGQFQSYAIGASFPIALPPRAFHLFETQVNSGLKVR